MLARGVALLRARTGVLASALAGFLAGCWLAATLHVPVPVPVAVSCAVVAGLAATAVRARALVVVTWTTLGFGLAAANHQLVARATVAADAPFTATGIVGSDFAHGTQVLRVRGGRVRLVALEEPLPLGAEITVSGRLRHLRGDERVLRRRHYARVDADVVVARVATERGPPPILSAANAVRARLQVAAGAVLGGDRAGLLLGLLIGDDRSLSEETVEDFRRSGLTHLLVVSGSNLGFVMAAVAFVASRLPLGRRSRLALAAAVLGFYVLVTRAEPSVLRAAAMAATAMAVALSGAPRDSSSAFGAAVLALLVCDPFLASSVGFQLSAAATGGILLAAGPVADRLGRRLPRHLAAALALSASAQLAVAPLLVWHFGRASLLGVVTNVAAVPLAGGLTVAGFVLAPIGVYWPRVMVLLGPPLDVLLRLGHLAAGLPGAELVVSRWTLPATAALLGACAALSRRWRAGAVAVVLLVVAVAWPRLRDVTGPGLCTGATFLDVGQGDATLLRGDDGAVVLVDVGRDDARLDGLLQRHGVERVDALVLTHGDTDHVGAVGAVLGRRAVGAVFLPDGITWPSRTSRGARDRIAGAGVEVSRLRTGDAVVVGGVRLRILHPDPGTVAERANDVALVAVVEVAGLRVLLTADADAEVQRRVLGHVGDVDAAKVPHHGSRDQEPALVREARPEVTVVPVGPNTYGHPTREALELYGGPGVEEFRTDVDGTVAVCATGRPHTALVRRIA